MGSFAQARILTTIEIDKPIVLQWNSTSGDWVAEFEFVLLQLLYLQWTNAIYTPASSTDLEGTWGPGPHTPGKSQLAIGFRKILIRKMKALFWQKFVNVREYDFVRFYHYVVCVLQANHLAGINFDKNTTTVTGRWKTKTNFWKNMLMYGSPSVLGKHDNYHFEAV